MQLFSGFPTRFIGIVITIGVIGVIGIIIKTRPIIWLIIWF